MDSDTANAVFFSILAVGVVVWLPFMIMGFYTRGRRQSKVFVENLIGSVEVLD